MARKDDKTDETKAAEEQKANEPNVNETKYNENKAEDLRLKSVEGNENATKRPEHVRPPHPVPAQTAPAPPLPPPPAAAWPANPGNPFDQQVKAGKSEGYARSAEVRAAVDAAGPYYTNDTTKSDAENLKAALKAGKDALTPEQKKTIQDGIDWDEQDDDKKTLTPIQPGQVGTPAAAATAQATAAGKFKNPTKGKFTLREFHGTVPEQELTGDLADEVCEWLGGDVPVAGWREDRGTLRVTSQGGIVGVFALPKA